jgi:hypothetical protein
MRFNIRIDAIWQGLLLLGGATSQNSYVILGDDGMHFRLGWGFNRTIPYDEVAAVFPRSWPFLYGIGWRSNFRGVLGLTGSYHDVVEVRLKERIGNWAGVFPVDRIAVSLEEPEAFIEELSRRTGLAEPPDINALSRPQRRPTTPKKAGGKRTAGRAGKVPEPVAAAVVTAAEVTTAAFAAAEDAMSLATAPAKPAAAKSAAATAPKPRTRAKAANKRANANGATPRKTTASRRAKAPAAGNGARAASAKTTATSARVPAAKKARTMPAAAAAKASGTKAASKKTRPAAAKKTAGVKAKAKSARTQARKPAARKPTARKRPAATATRTPARSRRSRSS